jgi:hypothetical protein
MITYLFQKSEMENAVINDAALRSRISLMSQSIVRLPHPVLVDSKVTRIITLTSDWDPYPKQIFCVSCVRRLCVV